METAARACPMLCANYRPLCYREFPQVEGFITNKVSLYDNVQISHKWGAWPRLILKGTGKQKETIRIDSWTTDNIVEYLERKSIVMRAAQT